MNAIGNVTSFDFRSHGHHRPGLRYCPAPERAAVDTLVERLVLGDGAAADELKSRYAPQLVAAACDIVDDEAEATRIVDLVFEEASAGWPPERGKVRRWLHRLVRRAAYARRRRLRELDA